MKVSVFLAPILRGVIIQKLGRPWIVQAQKQPSVLQKNAKSFPAIQLSPDAAKDENLAAQEIKTALNLSKGRGIPSAIEIEAGGEKTVFFTAPDYSLIGKSFEAWKGKHLKALTDRVDVLTKRSVLVTGGAQGFGEEIARGLAAKGAFVFIADLNKDGAQKVADSINLAHNTQRAFALGTNVADENSVSALFESITNTLGGIDLCISNAGVLRASSILSQDMDSFRFVTEINYTAFALISKYCALTIKRQFAAAPSWATDIIQINSKSGLEGSNKNGSYAGGKFGGIGLVQSFSLELVAYGIKVNAICPGNFFDGPLWSDPEKGLFVQYLNTGKVSGAKTIADVKAFYEAKVPMNRGCTGIDVLRAICYAVEQKYETGQAIPVTGGQVMLH